MWMKNELREFCEERLEVVKAISVIRENQVDKLWSGFLKGDKRVTWSRVWPLVVLGDWMQTNSVSG